jgi:serine/threonine-protein kinase
MSRPDSRLWQRWDEVDRLLSEALDLPAADRDAHVRHRTAEDVELRDLVLRLVDRVSHDDEEEWHPGEDIVLAAFSGEEPSGAPDAVGAGDVLGDYRIVRRIGRGGMATVYEAERADGAYDQRVALKVLRAGLDTEDIVRRFLFERQILSSLTHPHIGRLLDGGATSSGRPFLVMELVSGDPITVAADQRRLDIPARLRLFLDVVDAVRAAHRQLVVHRDIKPSNVLVDSDGRVKLLDFGIAKLLDRDDGLTDGAAALTPQYASPEQLEGGRITTATDVYQLGLLLRELLTGVPLRAWLFDASLPVKPSRVALLDADGAAAASARAAARKAWPDRLAKALRGDLDIVVGKAMRVDPEERYTSADELAADITRYLLGHAIVAHPESKAYRLRKFMGRHPFAVPGGLAAVGALVAFSTTVAIQNQRIVRERDAARVASRRALETQRLLVDLLRAPDPTRPGGQTVNQDITVTEALLRGRARIANELAGELEVKAALLEAMGRTFTGLARFETADTLLRESLEIRQRLQAADPSSMVASLQALAENFSDQREYRPADSLLHEIVRLRAATEPDAGFANLLDFLGEVRRDLGDTDSALVLVNSALMLRRSLGDTAGGRYIGTLARLAYALRSAQQFDSAEVLYREVIRRQELVATPDKFALALNYNNLGYLLRVREDFRGAEQSYRSALRLATEILEPGHATSLLVRQNLASVLELAGEIDEAFSVARDQIAAVQAEWPEGHWRVGVAHLSLGRGLMRHGRPAEALPALEAGVRSYVRTIGEKHDWTQVARADLSAGLLLAGRRAEGRTGLAQAVVALRPRRAELDSDSRFSLGRLATVLEQAGHGEAAVPIRALLDTATAR